MSDDTDTPRALLTEGEREAIDPESDMTPNNRRSHMWRIRRKIEKMEEDAHDIRKHRPEMYENLHSSVCDEEVDDRIDRLEEEIADLRSRHDDEVGETQTAEPPEQ